MARDTRGLVAAGAAALALLIAGLLVFFTGRGTASFGWFAYAPLSSDSFRGAFGGVVIWSHREAVGAGLVVLGLIVGAASAGYLLGRRHRNS